MLGSLKNSSSTRSPNFPHGKLKMLIRSLQLTHPTCRLELIMQAQVTHVGSSNHTGVLMTHLYKQRGQPHESYQFFRLEASRYKIIQVVLPVGPLGTTKDTYRIFFEVTIFQQDVTCVQEFIYPFTCILHEGEIDKQLQFLLEGLLQFRKLTSKYNMM